jgi:signal transduction histidine kinase
MRLALKLVLAFMLANIALAAIYGYLAVQREVRMFKHTASDEAESLGPAMQFVLANAWRTGGYQAMQNVVRKAGTIHEGELHIRWVWFDRPAGDPDAPSAPPELLTVTAIERHTEIEASDSAGNSVLDIYWPVPLAIDRRGGLEFSHSMKELAANERDIADRTALLIGGMVVISGFLAAWLGIRMIGRPLGRLIDKTRRIAAGDLADPVHLRTHDELADLAESMNQMCAQLAESHAKIQQESAARVVAIEQLRHTDRLKTVGRLAAGIAHELGTPLNVVSGRAGLILSGKLAADEIGHSATAIKTEVDKMAKIIRQLLDFARVNTPRRASVDLRQLVGQTISLLHTLADSRKVRLCFTADAAPAPAMIDMEQMQQALANLLVNAIQAMPQDGKVEVTIRREARHPSDESTGAAADAIAGNANYWCIAVRDEGTGIAAEHIPHLFEPFFTTKEVGEGTGLGLSIAYGIVQEHGGWIDVSSRPGEGSCFTVCLPEAPSS